MSTKINIPAYKLNLNQNAKIISFKLNKQQLVKLNEFGLFEGSEVQLTAVAPLSGPAIFKVNGTVNLGIDKLIASNIFVEILPS